MEQTSFLNPVVPYSTPINGGLMPGRAITIVGCVTANAHRFEVNLCHSSGIAMHYNPRFDEKAVVRTTLDGETWGKEERDGPMPFSRGHAFILTICCEVPCFRVFVDGLLVHNYKHRFDNLQQITSVKIEGDVTLTSVVV
ncbi:galectin-5-like [Periophthalmus magnuspinnatus]|uniref:galectin-5-like n=1 Tax=Periophthalmus magnuspinnatus TaxID=409849 RepID=UPI002436EF3A|nr:galectin-5-like [Periophthalmus magnuspinnatus]